MAVAGEPDHHRLALATQAPGEDDPGAVLRVGVEIGVVELHLVPVEAVGEVAGWITPRLGGVGPTTVALLLKNTVDAAERRMS